MSNFFEGLANTVSGGLIGGATSLIGNLINQKNANKMLDKQNEFTEKMWNQTNEYNNPVNTLGRYLDTGLNSGAAVQALLGSNSQASPVQSSTQQSPNIDLGADTIAGFNSGISHALVESQILKNKSDAGYSLAKTETENALRDLQAQGLSITNEFTEAQRNKVNAEIVKLDADRKLVEQETSLKKLLSDYQVDINDILSLTKQIQISLKTEELNHLRASIQEILSRTDLNKAETLYYQYQLNVCNSVIKLNNANAHKAVSDANLADENAHKVSEETDALRFENTPSQRDLRTQQTAAETYNKKVGSVTSFITTVGTGLARIGQKFRADQKRRAREAINKKDNKHVIKMYKLKDGNKRMKITPKR